MDSKENNQSAQPVASTGSVMDVQPPKKTAPPAWGGTASSDPVAPSPADAEQQATPTSAPVVPEMQPPEPEADPVPSTPPAVQPAPAEPSEEPSPVAVEPPAQSTPDTPAAPAVSPDPTPATTTMPPSTPPAEQPAQNPMAIPPKPVKHARPNGVVIAAIVIAVLLAVVAVVAYIKSKDTVSTNKNNTPSNVVSTSDVDKTQKEIDDTLGSLNDSTDLSSNDLSDSALGL